MSEKSRQLVLPGVGIEPTRLSAADFSVDYDPAQLVGEEGIEPSSHSGHDFKSCAYTSSATRPPIAKGYLYQFTRSNLLNKFVRVPSPGRGITLALFSRVKNEPLAIEGLADFTHQQDFVMLP